jgi:hypothetical protein
MSGRGTTSILRETHTYSLITDIKGVGDSFNDVVARTLNVFTSRAVKVSAFFLCGRNRHVVGSIPKIIFISGSVAPAPTEAITAAVKRSRSFRDEYENTRYMEVSLHTLCVY